MINSIQIQDSKINKVLIAFAAMVASAALAVSVGPALPVSAAICVHNNPQVTYLTPAEQSGDPGQTLTYQVSVTNADDVECPMSNFVLDILDAPYGWTVTYSPDGYVPLEPSDSATFDVNITSPAGVVNGPYNFSFQAREIYSSQMGDDAYKTTPFNLTYTVVNGSGADTTAPEVTITSPQNGSTVARNSYVTINTLSSDNVGVAYTAFYVNNELVCSGAQPSCLWLVPRRNNQTYNIVVEAYDAAGNYGTDSVTVQTQ